MEDDNIKKIQEEIRQYKLYKIQTIESTIREYENTFNFIKENIVIKFTKNASSNILRIIFFLVTLVLFLIGVSFLFPGYLIQLMNESEGNFIETEKNEFSLIAPYFGYVLISISILFGFISSLLKKNIRKRNTIYNLSQLVKEVIDYMDENVKEDKKKYEYFVDSSAEIEHRRKNNEATPE